MYGNRQPNISNKKLVRVCLALTILAWATQVLFKQWGFGAEVGRPSTPAEANAPASIDVNPDECDAGPAVRPAAANEDRVASREPAAPAERFVTPRLGASTATATLELRAEASVAGSELRLKQVAQWSRRDAEFFRQVGELVIARFDGTTPYKPIEQADVRRKMADAGVSLASVRFAGPTRCAVNRTDARPDSGTALDKWIDSRETAGKAPAGDVEDYAPLPQAPAKRPTVAVASARPASADAVMPAFSAPTQATLAGPAAPAISLVDRSAVRSLRDLLTDDLSIRLKVPLEQLQVTFDAQADRLLSLSQPQFKFTIEPQRVQNLGPVVWDVTVVSEGSSRKATVGGTARAWQSQVTVAKPVPYRAVLRADDVSETRQLVDRLPDEPLLTADQCVGQQAARDLRPGVVMTGRMVEAVPLAARNDLVTVTLTRGTIQLQCVGRAIDGGSYGQRIQVKNELTNDVYDAVLTGPKTAVAGDVQK